MVINVLQPSGSDNAITSTSNSIITRRFFNAIYGEIKLFPECLPDGILKNERQQSG